MIVMLSVGSRPRLAAARISDDGKNNRVLTHATGMAWLSRLRPLGFRRGDPQGLPLELKTHPQWL